MRVERVKGKLRAGVTETGVAIRQRQEVAASGVKSALKCSREETFPIFFLRSLLLVFLRVSYQRDY